MKMNLPSDTFQKHSRFPPFFQKHIRALRPALHFVRPPLSRFDSSFARWVNTRGGECRSPTACVVAGAEAQQMYGSFRARRLECVYRGKAQNPCSLAPYVGCRLFPMQMMAVIGLARTLT